MKKVIMSTGDKGGAGKSMTARLIGEILTETRPGNLLFFDGDSANPDLEAIFENREKVFMFSPRDSESIDRLIDSIFSAPEGAVILMDMPAGAGEHLKNEVEMFSAIFAEPGIDCEIIWTMNTDETGIIQLGYMMTAFEDVPARYTVVKNQFYGEDFSRWERSSVRKKLMEKSPETKEVFIPKIEKRILETVGNLSFEKAVKREYKDVSFSASHRLAGDYKKAKLAFDHLVSEPVTKTPKKTEAK